MAADGIILIFYLPIEDGAYLVVGELVGNIGLLRNHLINPFYVIPTHAGEVVHGRFHLGAIYGVS